MNSIPRQPLVLVIENDPEVLGEVTAVLTTAGYASRTCGSAEAALRAAHSTAPDLIICDVHLHGQSGPDLCEMMKLHGDRGDVPVMFLSGTQTPDIVRRSHGGGGAYYLRKPFDPAVLLELVDSALRTPPPSAGSPHLRRPMAARS